MKRISTCMWMVGAALGLALAPCAARAEASADSVLLWMVYDNYGRPVVPDTGPADLKYIDELVSRPDGYHVNGARLRVAGTDTYLDVYENAGGDPLLNQMLPIEKDPDVGYFYQAGPVWTDLGSYATTEYSFLVELGHWENDEWTVMAASLSASFEELREGGWTTAAMHNVPEIAPWTPTYAVPEPSGGLLLLVGGALLALRRRRGAGVAPCGRPGVSPLPKADVRVR